MQVPLLDLKLQFKELRSEIMPEIEALIDSQNFILGPKVEGFEAAIAAYTGANHAIGVSSGTDALLLILMALGVGPGDAVITTPYTFFATAGGIARVGATPVFIDIDPATFNISVNGLRDYLERRAVRNAEGEWLSHAGQKLRALMPVHLFGLSCPMDDICELGARFGLPIIEDAAQALGANYPSRNGSAWHCGAIGEFGYYSFFPSKNLGGFGDGGMVVCRDEAMAVKMRALRNHGMEERYYHKMIGGNFRIDALQAAVLALKLPHLENWSSGRRANAKFYHDEFTRVGLHETLSLPVEPYAAAGVPNHHIYNQFVIRAPRRDELCKHLAGHGIGHAIYYPVALHRQECFDYLGYREGDFPEAERAASESLALPIFPELTRDQQAHVVATIRDFYR